MTPVVKSGLEEAVARNVIGLTVVHDPIDVGGFREGTHFGHDEWVAMMKYYTFTPGTILQDADGRKYEVAGAGRGRRPAPIPVPNEENKDG